MAALRFDDLTFGAPLRRMPGAALRRVPSPHPVLLGMGAPSPSAGARLRNRVRRAADRVRSAFSHRLVARGEEAPQQPAEQGFSHSNGRHVGGFSDYISYWTPQGQVERPISQVDTSAATLPALESTRSQVTNPTREEATYQASNPAPEAVPRPASFESTNSDSPQPLFEEENPFDLAFAAVLDPPPYCLLTETATVIRAILDTELGNDYDVPVDFERTVLRLCGPDWFWAPFLPSAGYDRSIDGKPPAYEADAFPPEYVWWWAEEAEPWVRQQRLDMGLDEESEEFTQQPFQQQFGYSLTRQERRNARANLAEANQSLDQRAGVAGENGPGLWLSGSVGPGPRMMTDEEVEEAYMLADRQTEEMMEEYDGYEFCDEDEAMNEYYDEDDDDDNDLLDVQPRRRSFYVSSEERAQMAVDSAADEQEDENDDDEWLQDAGDAFGSQGVSMRGGSTVQQPEEQMENAGDQQLEQSAYQAYEELLKGGVWEPEEDMPEETGHEERFECLNI